METRDVIAMGVVDHTSCLYSFSYFVDNDDDIHDVPKLYQGCIIHARRTLAP